MSAWVGFEGIQQQRLFLFQIIPRPLGASSTLSQREMVHFCPGTIALFAARKQICDVISQPVVASRFVIFFDFPFWTVILNVARADGQGTALSEWLDTCSQTANYAGIDQTLMK